MALTEREKYQEVWRDENYREKCHGLDLYRKCPEVFGEFKSVLDIGCGRGLLFAHLADLGKSAFGVDIADNSLDPDVSRRHGHRFSRQELWDMIFELEFDLGICCDVLEHVPPNLVDNTLGRIRASCRRRVLSIANFPSSIGNRLILHLTLRDAEWWRSRLEAHGGAVKSFDPGIERVGPVHYFVWEG